MKSNKDRAIEELAKAFRETLKLELLNRSGAVYMDDETYEKACKIIEEEVSDK